MSFHVVSALKRNTTFGGLLHGKVAAARGLPFSLPFCQIYDHFMSLTAYKSAKLQIATLPRNKKVSSSFLRVQEEVSQKETVVGNCAAAAKSRGLGEEAWRWKKVWYRITCLGSKDTCPIVRTNILRAKLDSVQTHREWMRKLFESAYLFRSCRTLNDI